MARCLTVKILPDGTIRAETHGVKGKACTKYMRMLEEMLEAEVVSSAYTSEYYEETPIHDEAQLRQDEQQTLKGGA